jgi:hypothetical protein
MQGVGPGMDDLWPALFKIDKRVGAHGFSLLEPIRYGGIRGEGVYQRILAGSKVSAEGAG